MKLWDTVRVTNRNSVYSDYTGTITESSHVGPNRHWLVVLHGYGFPMLFGERELELIPVTPAPEPEEKA